MSICQLRQPFMFGPAQSAHGLNPDKGFFDHLAAAQAHGVALTPRGSSIDCAAAGLAGDVRLQISPFEPIHKFRRVIAFVGTALKPSKRPCSSMSAWTNASPRTTRCAACKLGRCFRPQFARIPAASKGRRVSHQPARWLDFLRQMASNTRFDACTAPGKFPVNWESGVHRGLPSLITPVPRPQPARAGCI
jgi:hypothetical protein